MMTVTVFIQPVRVEGSCWLAALIPSTLVHQRSVNASTVRAIFTSIKTLQFLQQHCWYDYTSPVTLALNLEQFFDYFVTLQREVEFVWPSERNFMKILFFISRYSPFLDVPLDVYCEPLFMEFVKIGYLYPSIQSRSLHTQ